MKIQICLATDLEVYTGGNGFYAWTQPDLKSVRDLISAVSPMEISKPLELHTTIMYSKTPLTVTESVPSKVNTRFKQTARVLRLVWWTGHDETGYLVARIEAGGLKTLHDKWKRLGAIPTFPDYEAHMTLANPCPETPALKKFIAEKNAELSATPLYLTFNTERISDLS